MNWAVSCRVFRTRDEARIFALSEGIRYRMITRTLAPIDTAFDGYKMYNVAPDGSYYQSDYTSPSK